MTGSSFARRRGRWLLLLVALLFLGPVALAWLLYYGHAGWHPTEQANHGQLVDPVRPLAALALPELGGGGAGDDRLDGVWSLIMLSRDGCGPSCREVLADTRQVWALLGREQERVQRLLLVAGPEPDSSLIDAELRVLDASGPAGRDWIAQLDAGDPEGVVWLTDPLGNLVLVYPAGSDALGLREDLKRLLKLSRIG